VRSTVIITAPRVWVTIAGVTGGDAMWRGHKTPREHERSPRGWDAGLRGDRNGAAHPTRNRAGFGFARPLNSTREPITRLS